MTRTIAGTVPAVVSTVPGYVDATVAVGVERHVSPSWRGASSHTFRVQPPLRARGDARPELLVKTVQPYARAIHLPTAFAGARAAGEAGLAPRVLATSVVERTIVMIDASVNHRVMTLDLADRASTLRLVAVKRAVHDLRPQVTRTASVFDDLDRVLAGARSAGAWLPEDLDALLATVAAWRERCAVVPLVFCHGDGAVSNVLLPDDSDADPLLVGWGSCAMMDPAQDFGSLVAEITPDPELLAELGAAYFGRDDPDAVERALVLGAVDHLRCAIAACWADACAEVSDEYLKLACWRLLRFRRAVRELRGGTR